MSEAPDESRARAVLRSPVLVAALLAVLTLMTLLGSEASVGYVRDEGIYFEASRHYGAWLARAAREPGKANESKVRDRYFAINHEHPALMKLAAGASARLLAKPPDPAIAEALERELAAAGKSKKARRKVAWKRELAAVEGGRIPVLREGAAMRLPAMLMAALAVALLYLGGHRLGGTSAGLLAAGAFALLPRVLFHASLHAFDVPIATMTLVVALAWLRALKDWRWGLALGPLLGVAIAVKHNALFLGPLLAAHLWLCLGLRWWKTGERPRLAQIAPLPLWAMAVIGPLVAVALWPWLWHDTFARIAEYFAFHSEHSYYNMEFFGRNYNRPPLPVAYPWVMTWATVPSVLLVLTTIGAGVVLRRAFTHERDQPEPKPETTPSWLRPLPTGGALDSSEAGLLFVGLAAFPLVLISLPNIPIFGGTKHWLTAYPFFALLAAGAWSWLWSAVMPSPDDADAANPPKRWRSLAPALSLLLVLGPSAWASVHGHPFNLSQYAPLAGGARGAAQLGLNRGYWGHAVVPLLDEGETLPPGPVYVHDVHALAIEQYRREGRWPGWKRSGVSQAKAALLFPERHMVRDTVELRERFGPAPAMILTLDDVPVTVVYAD